jgi:hypothetical protein
VEKGNITLTRTTNTNDYNWHNHNSLFPGSLELLKDITNMKIVILNSITLLTLDESHI